MNNIYRVIYNKSTQTFQAVCEYARAQGKGASGASGSSSKSRMFRLSAIVMAMVMGSSAYAADYTAGIRLSTGVTTPSTDGGSVIIGSNTVNGAGVSTAPRITNSNLVREAVIIGDSTKLTAVNNPALPGYGTGTFLAGATIIGASAEGRADASSGALNYSPTALGGFSKAFGDGTVAVGEASHAEGLAAISIGAESNAAKAKTIAIGNKAIANTTGDIAIGELASATGRSTATAEQLAAATTDAQKRRLITGETYGPAMAQGFVATATGRNAIALGNNAQAGNAANIGSANDTIAIGANTIASNDRATAIGYHADATGITSVALGHAANAGAQNMVAIGPNAGAGVNTNTHGVAIGVSAGSGTASSGTENVAIGKQAGINVNGNTNYAMGSGTGNAVTGHDNLSALINAGNRVSGSDNIAIGKMAGSDITANTTVALGAYARGTANNAVAVGGSAEASGVGAIAIGSTGEKQNDRIQTLDERGHVTANNTKLYAQGAIAKGKDSIAIGTDANVNSTTATNAIAIGTGATATGVSSISIGTKNSVTANNAGAIGDPSFVEGENSYSYGNHNVISNTSNNAFVIGNRNEMGGTALYNDDGSLSDKTTITPTSGGVSSVAIGNNNRITSNNTYVLGSGINTIEDPALGRAALNGTIDNSVYLGDDSHAVAGTSTVGADGVGLNKNNRLNSARPSTTSTGGMGAVNSATVNNITYGGFAGTTPVGIVTVGTGGAERRIQNVAAGEISRTSTDAINGSQLYIVADELSKRIGTEPETYFHVHTGTNANTGNRDTNLGKISDAAGARYVGSVTAGVNAIADSAQSIAIGQNAKAGSTDSFDAWADVTDPRTGAKFASKEELVAYYNEIALKGTAGRTAAEENVFRNFVGKQSNIAIGNGAAAEGGRNISIGEFAGVGSQSTWGIQNVNIGTEAAQNSKRDYSVAIGHQAGQLTTAQQAVQATVADNARHPSIVIGKEAGKGTVAYGTVAMGQEAGKDIADVRSVHNIAIGRNAGQGVSSNDGRNATFPGFGAGANTLMGASAGRNLSGDGNVAIGNLTGQGTTGDNNIMMGHLAGSGSTTNRSIIMGNQTGWNTGTNDRNVLIGNFVNGGQKADVTTAVGIGHNTIATGNSSVSIGNQAKATAVNSIAQGTQAVASGENAISIGAGTSFLGLPVQPNTASGEKSIALGYANNATGSQAIAIGTGNEVSGNNSGALGDPSIIAGAGSYTVGNDNAVGSTSSNVGAFGNNNQIGATATYDAAGKLQLADGLTDTAAVSGSRVVGNNNTITTNETFVLGNRVTTTADNSVFLGTESAYTAKGDSTDGIGAVTEPVSVNGVSYGDFAGKTSVGVVSVGDVGKERRIQNVAAGLISATSTDAINGSQLYLVTQGTLDQMPVVYTDADGNKVVKQPDGTFINPETGDEVAPTNVIASMNNPNGETNDAPMTLANVGSALTTTPTTINPTGTDQRTEAPILNIPADGSKDDNAATVGDLRNMGWVVAAEGNSYSDVVRNANEVRFVGTGMATVTGETVDNIRTITVNVDAQQTVESAQLPVVYTNTDGDKLIKVGDNFYPAGSVVSPNGDVYPEGTVLSNTGEPTDPNVQALNPTDKADVIASMNNADGSTTAPMTLTNIEGNLDGAKTDTTAPTTVGTAPANVADISNNAATVGDVLNAGWNLQGNGEAKDFVKPYDTVNFVNGAGTTAVVESDGETSSIKFDVNVDNDTITTKQDPADPNKTVITANTTPLADADNDGKVDEPTAPNALVNAQNVADAINNSGWNLAADGTEGTELINPSDTVTFKTGSDNLTVKREGADIIYDLADDINVSSVQFNDGPKITNDGDNIKVEGPTGEPVKITNVAEGTDDNDAVNVSQLKDAQAAATTKVEEADGINVEATENEDGSTTYTVSAKTDGVTTYVDNNGNIAAVTTTFEPSTDGKVGAPVDSGDSLVTANTVADAINNSGWNLAADGTEGTELINPSDTVTFKTGSDNLTVKREGADIIYDLADDINVSSVQFNDGPKITNDGDNIKVEGPTGEPVKITNVAEGTDDNDAVNVSQLNAAKSTVEGDEGVSVTPTTNADGSTTYTVAAKTDGVTTYVDNNGNIAAVTTTFEPSTDGKVGAPVDSGDSLVTANTVADAINNSGWNLAADGTEGTELINPSDTVTFKTGSDNLTVKREGADIIYDLADDINVSSVQFNDGPKITNDGDNIKVEGPTGEPVKITNVAEGTDDNDAVNVSQLKDAQAAATTKVEEADGINVEATENEDGSTTYTVSAKTDGVTTYVDNNGNIAAVTTTFEPSTDGKVGAPVDSGDSLVTANTVADAINNSGWNLAADGTEGTELINPSDTVTFKTGSDNLTVKREGADIIYDLADDINVSSVQFNDGPKITNDGDNIKVEGPTGEPVKITNVAEGTDDNDAVNVSQLKDAQAAATTKVEEADGINVEATENEDGSTTYTVSAKTDGVTTYVDNNGNIAAITGDLNTSTDGSVSSEMPNSLVTGDQVANAINNSGWNLLNNGAQRDVVRPADAVNFINGNGTTAVVETAADGKSSTVKFDVKVDNDTIKVNDNGELYADVADTNTVTKVTAGKNMVVKNTGTDDAPNYEVKTADDVNFNSVTVGPVVINQDGINAGDKKITNVAAGDISADSKDAVNGSQLYALANEINTNIAAAKTEVESSDNSVGITTTTNNAGATVYDLSVKTDGDTIKKNDDGSLAVNTTPLTNKANGAVNTPAAPNAIATAGDVANAINNSGFTLTAQGKDGSVVNPGETVDMNNTDGNIVITKPADSNNVTYNLAKDVKVDSVTAGGTVVNNGGITIAAPTENNPDNVVSLTQTGLNNGGNRITNVAPGVDATDAVNVSQLQGTANYLNNRIDGVADDANAGVSSAMAMAALPQAYIPGKSMLTGGIASYNGEGAVAVGFSKLSDNGRWVLKVSGSADTQGNAGGAVGAGFHF